MTATDTSAGALEVARGNAERLGLADRVRFLEGTLPEGESFDLVLANLPYVAERDWPSLQPEVTAMGAARGAPRRPRRPRRLPRLHPRVPVDFVTAMRNKRLGALAVEVGEGQAEAVGALMREAGFGAIETRRDLAGIERVVLGRVGGAA